MNDRVDVIAIKNYIVQLVGEEKGTAYWDTVKNFLLARLNKIELDFAVKSLLGEHVPLHNRLIKGIIFNSYSVVRPDVPPPIATPSVVKAKKRKKTKLDKGTDQNKLRDQSENTRDADKHNSASSHGSKLQAHLAKLKPLARPIAKRSQTYRSVKFAFVKARIHASNQQMASSTKATKSKGSKKGKESAASKKAKVAVANSPFGPELAVKTNSVDADGVRQLELPDANTLRMRMNRAALDCGLVTVADDAVLLTMRALEHRLKDIIQRMIETSRTRPPVAPIPTFNPTPFPAIPLPPGKELPDEEEMGDVDRGSRLPKPLPPAKTEEQREPLGPRNLFATLTISPYLLGDDHGINLERANLRQHE